jgi:hypothetical protein
METPKVEDQEGQEGQDKDPAPVHYSTGRLTRGQAALVNTWRARLLEDRPLPGRARVGGMAAALTGLDDRPPASCSDVIAAAVEDLMRQPPDALDLARYAHAGWQAQRAAARGNRDDGKAPLYPPVSFYLPPELAESYEALRARAYERVQEAHQELEEEAARRYPEKAQADERATWLAIAKSRHGLPHRPRKIPGGAAARMAIDRWARRSADRVCADAVAYAADAHEQPHRGRRDMYELRR